MTRTIAELINTEGNSVVAEIAIKLKQGDDIDERDPELDCTGLHHACKRITDADLFSDYYIGDLVKDYIRIRPGDAALVEFLLENSAEVDALDKLGHTPLYYACMIDCPQVIMLLVKAGADVNARDDKGISILEHLLIDMKLIKANDIGILMEADNEKLVKINAIRILCENGVDTDNLSAKQKANLKIIETSIGKQTYCIGRLSDRVPYGPISDLEFWNVWREYKELFMYELESNRPLDQDEVQILDTLHRNQTRATIKEWFYILNALKFYLVEYWYVCRGVIDTPKNLFKGPFDLIPKLVHAQDFVDYLPELLELLHSGAFDDISSSKLALPDDVQKHLAILNAVDQKESNYDFAVTKSNT